MQALTAGPAAAPRRQIIVGTTLGAVTPTGGRAPGAFAFPAADATPDPAPSPPPLTSVSGMLAQMKAAW